MNQHTSVTKAYTIYHLYKRSMHQARKVSRHVFVCWGIDSASSFYELSFGNVSTVYFPLHFIIDKWMDTEKTIWFRCHQERKYFSRTIIKGKTREWLYGRNIALFYKCAYNIGIIYVKGNTIYFLKHFSVMIRAR